MKTIKLLFGSLAVAALAAFPLRARADSIFNVNINTSSISGLANSEMVFEFSDGDQSFASNNTATLTSFDLGGGTAGGVDPNSAGPYTGDIGSTLALQDGTPITAFGQFFTPGSSLSFTLDLTTNLDAGTTPDEFSMYIYDPLGNPLATTSDPTGFDSLLSVNLDSTNPSADNYDPAGVTASPTSPSTVPQPPTLLLASTGLFALLGLGAVRRRRGAARA